MKNYQQINALKNLTVETLMGVDNVRFDTLACAFPGVVEAKYSISDEEGIGELEGEEIEVVKELNLKPDTSERMIITDKYIVVGGLCYDSDCENPMTSCDGQGAFHKADSSEYQQALGLDRYAAKDYSSDAVLTIAAEKAWGLVRQTPGMIVQIRRLMNEYSRVDSVKTAIENYFSDADQSFMSAKQAFLGRAIAELDNREDELFDRIIDLIGDRSKLLDDAWVAAIKAGTLGNNLAVPLRDAHHGYSMTDDFDRSHAVWLPESIALDNIKSGLPADADAEALVTSTVNYCSLVLEEYNSWCAGECYGVVVYVIDRETGERIEDMDEECWGYIGSDYAESELESQMLSHLKSLAGKAEIQALPLAA